MARKKAQTTIEYLLLISVVVLLFVGLLVTINSLRQEAGKSVNVDGQEETPVQAIGGQLDELRQIGSGGGGGSALHLSIALGSQGTCAFESITVTVTNENGPVPGATVTLSSETSVVDTKATATDGVVVFTPQSVGSYVLSAEKQDNEPASLQFTVGC